MVAISKANCHPAARYNAMLMIGKLNKEEGALVGDNKKLPVPLILALRTMLEEIQDPKQIDAVRVAALVGVLRHIEVDRQLATENRRLVGNKAETFLVDTMLQLIGQKEPPAGRSRDGHAWMRRTAVDILAKLGAPGQGGKVVRAFESLTGDDQELVSLRSAAAAALGYVSYPQDLALNAKEMAKKLAGVAVVASMTEVKRVEDRLQQEQKEQAPGSGRSSSGYPGGGMEYPGSGPGGMFGPASAPGRTPFDPLGYRLDGARRAVKYPLVLVKRGLIGPDLDQEAGIVTLAKQDADKQYVAKVVDAIDKIISVVDSTSSKDLTSLAAAIRTNVTTMENNCEIVVKQPGGAAPPMSKEEREKLLANPDDLEPAKPPVPPAGKPGVKPPAGTPPAKVPPAKTPPEKAPAEKVPAEEAPPVKAPADKAAPQKVPAEKAPPAKPAAASVAADGRSAAPGQCLPSAPPS